MSQKSSLIQSARFVSKALTPDRQEYFRKKAGKAVHGSIVDDVDKLCRRRM